MEATIHQFPLFSRAPRISKADVDVSAISRPARAFTGDFYFVHRQGRTLWVVIGDVAGKGIKAAVIMAMIQEELESDIIDCAMENNDPSVTITRLDLFLRRLLPSNRFATMAVAQIRDDGRLIVANGGHPPLLVARGNGTIETIDSTGPVVGLLPSPHWRSISKPFHRGDALLAYTDGVIEARSPAGEEFGSERLRRLFAKASRARGASVIAETIDSALPPQEDDLTIIVARR